MSGFAGIICTGGNIPDPGLLERMAGGLEFRGPDATQIWSRGSAGFCFTLLRTGPAPQSSEQPCTLDGRVWLLGDVRLDGREDLRRQLDESISAEATDEELILRAWRRWGKDGFANLNGDLSFALWDEPARHLLQEWCQDGTRTVYQDIHRLPAGHTLVYSDGELRVRRYTDFSVEEPLWLKRPEEYVERFQELLVEAVRDRLPRGPCGIFMSGGLDSTSVAAVACKIAKQEQTSGPLRAYTIDCRPMFNDEEGFLASLVAKKLGIDIEILSGASCLPYQGWEDSLLHTPEPCHDPFLLLSQRQYRQVQSHARVVLSGYGGDDILTGQAWPYLTYLFRQRAFGTIMQTYGRYILEQGRIPPLRGGFRTRLRRWMGRTNPLTEFPEWLERQFVERHNLRERWWELQEAPKTIHPLHPIAFAGLTSKYWSRALECEDAGWTGVPVELRAPLLDQRLLRFLLRVPPVPWCMEKVLLCDAMRGMLPEQVRARPKTPLLGDLIKHSIESKKWRPVPVPEPPPELQKFVDWKRLGTTLATAAGSTLWVGLRSVTLCYWLRVKGVVNDEGIR